MFQSQATNTITLFKKFSPVIDTSKYSHALHDSCVTECEKQIASFTGGKYACGFNSATSAIFTLATLLNKQTYTIPYVIPPVVVNACIQANADIEFTDDVNWVGKPYFLSHNIIDSAQHISRNQLAGLSKYIAIYSFYPTKPLGGYDGGMVVSDDKNLIEVLKIVSMNGMTNSTNSWDKQIKYVGFKNYLSSIQADIILQRLQDYESELKTIGEIRRYYDSEFGRYTDSDHLYRLNVDDGDRVRHEMLKAGIVCGKHYTPIHFYDVYKKYGPDAPLLSDKYAATTISIPMHSGMTLLDAKRVVDTLKSTAKWIH